MLEAGNLWNADSTQDIPSLQPKANKGQWNEPLTHPERARDPLEIRRPITLVETPPQKTVVWLLGWALGVSPGNQKNYYNALLQHRDTKLTWVSGSLSDR
jgi:hypothetical protein